ncbi:DNA-binding transcriptional regulator, XRE-family HTH domain [Cyclonatronum proteinivorum]|uniref:DNA-binding transcriptional regulator, XRE-family HTH domain n=1 Tax=Cyclonatronum proteinivorum TaxID=1457365 RepID=A0A345UGS3_9BACT|nr:helix-turn-helix transcriptional regulator [Cyclonatronum proteinivorum]AXI99674.1 DNA-binding transcriptional regulator, XRE-family HTH domain [Cyclonatronum proteinivorum]
MGFREVGDAIRRQRVLLGVTQPDLAEIAGVSVNTLCNIERGQANPTLKVLLQLAEVLGLELKLMIKSPGEVTK